jgi:hypothetical protein
MSGMDGYNEKEKRNVFANLPNQYTRILPEGKGHRELLSAELRRMAGGA